MGIIIKQTVKGSLWSYLGVIIGFVTTTYFYTEYLTPEIVGLFGLLVAISTITGGLSSLGLPGVTARLFPRFRSKADGHHGFLLMATLPQIAGFGLFLLLYFIFREQLIQNNLGKSELFADYVWLLIPLTLFTLIFVFLDTYNKVLYDAVLGTFLQEFLQRFLIFVVVALYMFKWINLEQLIIGYAIAVSVKAVVIFVFLLFRGEITFRSEPGFIDPSLKKEIFDVALFSIIGGLGSLVVFNIDKIVINQMLDLGNTGVYSIAFYFGTLVVIPSRPLLKIAGTLIADGWSNNDMAKIKEIYYRSCINQFIIGGFLFLGIWANIDNILAILGPDYQQSKWVIFFIGLGYLFDMMTGANGLVIGYSKYYRVSLWFILILVVTVVGLLYLFIPLWGITGAALAIALALLMNNLMRHLFLVVKYGLQPFTLKFVMVAVVFMAIYLVQYPIPQLYFLIDILVRGTLIVAGTGLMLVFLPVSDDFQAIWKKGLSLLKRK